jgi:hypothetical protein
MNVPTASPRSHSPAAALLSACLATFAWSEPLAGLPATITFNTMGYETRHFINGEFVESKSGKTFDVMNPHTEKLTAKVSEGQAEDIDIAVEAALKAQKKWAAVPPFEKSALLTKLGDLIAEHADEIAAAEAESMGAPAGGIGKMIAQMGGQVRPFRAGKVRADGVTRSDVQIYGRTLPIVEFSSRHRPS